MAEDIRSAALGLRHGATLRFLLFLTLPLQQLHARVSTVRASAQSRWKQSHHACQQMHMSSE